MKLCPKCDHLIAEEIRNCPVCGSDIGAGRTHIDDYRILDILHEGHSSLLCKALRERTNETVMIRLFTAQSGVDNEVAFRLQRELELLKQLAEKWIRAALRYPQIQRRSLVSHQRVGRRRILGLALWLPGACAI